MTLFLGSRNPAVDRVRSVEILDLEGEGRLEGEGLILARPMQVGKGKRQHRGGAVRGTAPTTGNGQLGQKIRAALEAETRINLRRYPIRVERGEGAWVLEGEVESVSAKKLALRLAGAAPAVTCIVDRLRVAPKNPMSDAEIRDRFRDALLREPALEKCGIELVVEEHREVVRQPATKESGIVRASVRDGAVTLEGRLPSLSHQRLAGVLAWWIPGTRDVVNGLTALREREDSDAELADAVQLVLTRDPRVDAGGIRVRCRNGIVILEGSVPDQGVADMAVSDAWCVLGVEDVISRLEVQS